MKNSHNSSDLGINDSYVITAQKLLLKEPAISKSTFAIIVKLCVKQNNLEIKFELMS